MDNNNFFTKGLRCGAGNIIFNNSIFVATRMSNTAQIIRYRDNYIAVSGNFAVDIDEFLRTHAEDVKATMDRLLKIQAYERNTFKLNHGNTVIYKNVNGNYTVIVNNKHIFEISRLEDEFVYVSVRDVYGNEFSLADDDYSIIDDFDGDSYFVNGNIISEDEYVELFEIDKLDFESLIKTVDIHLDEPTRAKFRIYVSDVENDERTEFLKSHQLLAKCPICNNSLNGSEEICSCGRRLSFEPAEDDGVFDYIIERNRFKLINGIDGLEAWDTENDGEMAFGSEKELIDFLEEHPLTKTRNVFYEIGMRRREA